MYKWKLLRQISVKINIVSKELTKVLFFEAMSERATML
jgi:hypothetical protein